MPAGGQTWCDRLNHKVVWSRAALGSRRAAILSLFLLVLFCCFGWSSTQRHGSYSYDRSRYGGSVPTTAPYVNHRTREKMLLDEILGNGTYDRKIRPSSKNGDSTTVTINIMIRSINKIDDYHMEYSVQMTFREKWNDARLTYGNQEGRIKYLTLTETDKIWMPDLFFKNEKTGHFHNIILPNTYIRIFPDGNVLYSIRISLTLSCPMDLKLYPLDTQICELRMASYGWTTEDLLFKWKENEPIQVTKELHLPRFTLEHFETKYCNSKTNTGEYSCLMVNLTFKREFSYYLIQYYIPCCMLVIVSWVSFWLDQHAVPARVALGVTTLLTMSTQTAGINQSLPPVSYTKAIDVWTGMCLTFVFSALLEFALVNYASRSDMQREKLKLHRRYDMETQASFESGIRSATSASTSTSPHHLRHPHHDPSAPSTSNHRHRPPQFCRHNSFGAEHDSPFNDYSTLVRETMENGVPTFAMRPLVPPYPHDSGGGSGGGGGSGSGVVSGGGPMNRLCEVHIQGHPSHHSHTPCTCFKTWLSKFPTKSKRIDVIARITFPLFFALFNVCYWSAYISQEESGDV